MGRPRFYGFETARHKWTYSQTDETVTYALKAPGASTFVELLTLGTGFGGAAADNALWFGIGTSADPALTEEADKDFIEVRAKSAATSGDGRLAYLRFDIGGIGGGGECLRAFTDLTAAAANANGAHISLQADDTGYVTGLGTGLRSQLYVKGAAVHSGGAYYGLMAEMFFEPSGDISGVMKHAVLEIATTGNATGQETCVNALSVDGTSAADATAMISSVALAEIGVSCRGIACLVNGDRGYIPWVPQAEWND